MNILITGGAGYIGSHTIIDLFSKNITSIFSIDNYLNSEESSYNKIEEITGKKVSYFNIDLKDFKSLNNFFKSNKINVVIHFAALKSVPESVDIPLVCYDNNLGGLINLLKCMELNSVEKIIFSSSCSIYGNPEKLPVNENTPFGNAESPYAKTKQIGENILNDYCKVNPNFKAISLRYFNPAGAHSSGLIGEGFTKRPNNLVPLITQSAAGLRGGLTVFGTDYNTLDGSCVRDYIHVEDIAEAHVLALQLFSNDKISNYSVINLGTGSGTSVLEILKSFEKVNNIKLDYKLGDRRAGDVATIYANNEKAKSLLNWSPKFSLNDIVKSAWKWQQNMKID